jgi:hypothetical protein
MATDTSGNTHDLNKISIATLNLHGFKNSWTYLNELTIGCDIIFVQEHWLLSCELHYLESLNDNFNVYAKSAMDDKISSGVLYGRPYGGVAVLVHKRLSGSFVFDSFDNDGRVVCIKSIQGGSRNLLFGCYLPCKGAKNYSAELTDVIGYMQSVIDVNPGSSICILGDFNFECTNNVASSADFTFFADNFDLSCCDDLNVSDINYSYHHDTLGQYSLIDHVFISSNVKKSIFDYKIIQDHTNPSDHFAVAFHLQINSEIQLIKEGIKHKIHEFRWDRADLGGYYNSTMLYLNKIVHNFSCDCISTVCYNKDHLHDIDIYYSEIIHCLKAASLEYVPRVPKGALKHYWSAVLDDLKLDSVTTYDMWVLCNKPSSGPIFNAMRSAKYKYKLAIRDAVKEYEEKYSDELYDSLCDKDMFSFWKKWNSIGKNKIICPQHVDGKTEDRDISDVFMNKFNEMNSISSVNALINSNDRSYYGDEDIEKWFFSIEEVDNAVFKDMKKGKAAGIDSITLDHIIYSHPAIITHLCKLFNLLLKHEYVPNQFGVGIVIPLVKDKRGDICNSDNYRGITVSPVLTKIFELCLLHKFERFFYTNDLQFGFKKKIGCNPAIYSVQQVVKYFTVRGSAVYLAALDASKAFDRLNHHILFDKLRKRNVPECFINILACWYNKLYSCVRWNSLFSAFFKVSCGVRQGGILSPTLFNIYADDLIDDLSSSGSGCHVNKIFFGCIMYADDIILLSPSVIGLQCMLDICFEFGVKNDIIFNSKKSVCLFVGIRKCDIVKCNMFLGVNQLSWVTEFKYLGMHFIAHKGLVVNVMPIKCKFYAALNSILCKCKYAAEPVKLQLIKSFCLPLLTYCVGAVELKKKALVCLSVCWNDAFRKIFSYNRSESVKELMVCCGELDFLHIYDMARFKFLKSVCSKCPFLCVLSSCLELQFCSLKYLTVKYGLHDDYSVYHCRQIFLEQFADSVFV